MNKPEAVAAAAATQAPDQSLRKVAVILRNLAKEVRDGLINAIKEKDGESAGKVAELMIIWEDITFVADRSLQQALRGRGDVVERVVELVRDAGDEPGARQMDDRVDAQRDDHAHLGAFVPSERPQPPRQLFA